MKTLFTFTFMLAAMAALGNSYTNLAGQAIAGFPVSIAEKTVVLTNGADKAVYRLAIFPDGERRRLAVDAGSAQFVPAHVRLALSGVEKAVRRSQQRAEKGLCTKEQSASFCAREAVRVNAYLAHEVAAGRLLPSEQALLLLNLEDKSSVHNR